MVIFVLIERNNRCSNMEESNVFMQFIKESGWIVVLILYAIFKLSQLGYKRRKRVGIRELSAAEAKSMIATKDLVLLDVRSKDEFEAGAIEGAINIDIREKRFVTELLKIDKKSTLLIYCASGMRSNAAAQTAERQGFKYIYNITGGLKHWDD